MEVTSAKSPFSDYKNTAIIIGLVVIVVFLITRITRAVQKSKEYDNLANDANAQIAFQLHAAFNPWGSPIFGISAIDWDGTDEGAAFALAAQIKDLNAVRASYKRLYNEELLERVATEFQNDQPSLERWMALAGNSTTLTSPVAGKSLVYAKQTAPMYDAENSAKVVKTLKTGELAGTYVRQFARKHSNGQAYQYIEVTYTDWWVLTFKAWIRKDFIKIA